MKKFINIISAAFLFVLMMSITFNVFAANSTVTYDGTLSSTATTTEVGNIVPGDTVSYTVEFENKSDKKTDWYVKNTIVTAFEDSKNASGGAYGYTLTYINPSGGETVLYTNDDLGGSKESNSKAPSDDAVGLHQVSTGTEEDIYLDTLAPGQKGQVRVTVSLEGESQGNAYANQAASLNLVFAVEPIIETTTTVINYVPGPNTGDTMNVVFYTVLLSLAIVSLFAVLLLRKKMKKEEEE
ncbi:MAG: LPXTG cell wall anchor domain-containing protein [Oscillospiraceae bacterium]|nr:LPXTG cell wall anchor domain-containing protein [Oscillospiraceae bacterium]